ncbi:MAG: asparagine synthase-related protein [Candidatus Aenigmatarchaeota archaeon]
MLKLMQHRGSDSFDIFEDEYVILGYCHFKVQKNDSEKRPVSNGKGSIFSMVDGLIFNYEKMRLLLEKRGYKFYTNTFEELFIYLYEEMGEEFLKYLKGDFSFCIYDSSKRLMILGKSLANNKNIFFTFLNNVFIFSSELKPILLLKDEFKIDFVSVSNFLTIRHIPFPRTLFENIKRIPPLHLLKIYKKDKNYIFYLSNYLDINLHTEVKKDERYFIRKIHEYISDIVKQQLFIVKKPAIFLSGGIDSTTLLYFLDMYSDEPIETFTIGIKEDLYYARLASNYFSTSHHEKIPTSDDIFNMLPTALWYLETPLAHSGAFLFFLPIISKNHRFVFWAQGNEELFYGREDYLILDKLRKLKSLFPFHVIKLPIVKTFPSKLNFILNLLFSRSDFERYIIFRNTFNAKEKRLFFNPCLWRSDFYWISFFKDKLSKDILKNYSFLTLTNGFLSDTFFNINQEVCNPFIDLEFIKFMYSIPSSLKIMNNTKRYLLMKIMKGKIPQEILKRKGGRWKFQTYEWIIEQRDRIPIIIEYLKEIKLMNTDINLNALFKKPDFNKIWSLVTLAILLKIFSNRKYIIGRINNIL